MSWLTLEASPTFSPLPSPPLTESFASPPSPPQEVNLDDFEDSPSPAVSLPPPPPLPASEDSPSPGVSLPPPPPLPASEDPAVSLPPPPPPSNGLHPGALAGLIVGAIIFLIGVAIFVIFYKRKKRKGAENRPGGPPQGPKDEYTTGRPQLWRQNNDPSGDILTLLPEPTPSPGYSPLCPSPILGPASQQPPSTSSSSGPEKLLASPSSGILRISQGTFTYEELAAASDGFSDSNLLGQGGFGYVHKGVLRDGRVVAIKQLKAGSGQGQREFQAEIEIISRIHHRHLVSLFGYCITGAQRMLVYEFIPNNTLEFHLHGKDRPTMNWSTRMKIAMGSAKGLAYLHEDCQPKIIHRDIKPANILLDDSFEAKVADFGLAKYSMDTDTHVTTRVMGTFGYLAPEYVSSGKLTEKSDIFSFGVVLLELITGHRPVNRTQSFLTDSIVDWARPLLKQALEDGICDHLVDPKLEEDYDSNELTRMLACAAASIRHSAWLRPQMSQILRALEGNLSLDDLNDGITPGHSRAFSSDGNLDYNSIQYREDLKKFRKMALKNSQEHGSSSYSGFTSYSGTHPSASSTEGQQTTQEMELQKKATTIKDSHESSR